MPSRKQEIRSFIVSNFLFGQDDIGLTDDTSFLDSRIIDSTGVLELVAFVERTYDVRIEDEELVPENLDSIDRLAAFIEAKLAGAGAAHAG
jgi:acyl carrier protein